MDWERIRKGFNDELGKIAAFNISNIAPETVMNNSLPQEPMETTGLQKARQILARADENASEKIAADPEKDPYVKARPWVGRALMGAGSGAMLSRLTSGGQSMRGTRTGAALGTGVAIADKLYTEKRYGNIPRRKKEKAKLSSVTDPTAALKASQKIGRFGRVATTNTIGKAGPGIKQQIPLIGRRGTLPGQK